MKNYKLKMRNEKVNTLPFLINICDL